MTLQRVHRIYTPKWGELEIEEQEDGIRMTLIDLRNNESTSHKYFYYKDSMAMMMLKLDAIVRNMEKELERRILIDIGLNYGKVDTEEKDVIYIDKRDGEDWCISLTVSEAEYIVRNLPRIIQLFENK